MKKKGRNTGEPVLYRVAVTRLVVGVSALIWASGSGCAAVVAETPQAREAHTRIESELTDNTQQYEAASAEESAVKEVLIHKIKRGYERFDLESIRSALAPGFQLRYVTGPGTLEIQNLEDYLRSRGRWKVADDPNRELLLSIRDMRTDVTQRKISVVAITTYKSRFFNPRFIETYLFEKTGENWFLKTLGMVPLHPQRPELHKVDIIVSDNPNPSSLGELTDEMIARGADALVEKYLERRRDQGFPGDEVERTVLFVFREPPRAGSSITVEHQFWRPWAQNLSPYRFTYKVHKSQPYFIIENRTQAGGSGGTITYRIFLDGKKLAEKVVRIL